jgi:pimeloyl-ACP methyl ester carboxylesterase
VILAGTDLTFSVYVFCIPGFKSNIFIHNISYFGHRLLRYDVGMIRPATLAIALISTVLPGFSQHSLSTREYFYIGGKYTGEASKEVMAGQMYVETLRPQNVTQKYPLVFFHGAGQTGTNWIETPDGRAGWADYFLGQGYLVYLVDQPARGRSPWHPSVNGPLQMRPPSWVEERFTAPEVAHIWPQARKHTQWPGSGRQGDPVFDAFYATQVEGLESAVETQTLVQAAGAALLDKVGPAIVVTHSQSGAFGWLLADARPKAVKGIVALEPNGPPFRDAVFDENKNRAWGLTDIPIAYDPPAKSPDELAIAQEPHADGPDLVRCWEQSGPPRRLVNLQGLPVLIVTAEASYHAPYDHCTARFLAQAGVANTHVRLGEHGIHGNGHMVMLEKNNLEIATLLQGWITGHVK